MVNKGLFGSRPMIGKRARGVNSVGKVTAVGVMVGVNVGSGEMVMLGVTVQPGGMVGRFGRTEQAAMDRASQNPSRRRRIFIPFLYW